MKSFLFVIDIQHGFINKNTLPVKEKIDKLIRSDIFDCVIATIYRNYADSPISQFMGWNEMKTKKDQSVMGLAQRSDYFVYKNVYSACSDSVIDMLKKENSGIDPECVYIAGVDTECCVLLTAADFFEKGIRPVVLADYCGSTGGADSHKAGILSMHSIIGENNIYSGLIHSKREFFDKMKKVRQM